jgi:precorrin-6B methylase 2
LNEAVQSLDKNGFKVDISEVSVSRAKTIGQKRHMSALNPVFIITGEKLKC